MKGVYTLVGMNHRGTEALVRSLANGAPLVLIREPKNKFDSRAVQVWLAKDAGQPTGQVLGYIARKENAELCGEDGRWRGRVACEARRRQLADGRGRRTNPRREKR